MVSVATTHLCLHIAKEALGNTWVNEHSYFPIKLYLQKAVVCQIWFMGYILPISNYFDYNSY